VEDGKRTNKTGRMGETGMTKSTGTNRKDVGVQSKREDGRHGRGE